MKINNQLGEKKKLLRHHYSVILNLIRKRGPISRIDIYKILNIRITTVTEVVKELLHSGMIIEVGSAKSRGGRRPVLLMINPDAGYIIGIDVRATVIRGVLTNLQSQIVAQQQEQIRLRSTRNSILQQTKKIINKLIKRIPGKKELLGIGISVAALVDSDTGVVKLAVNIPGWRNLPLKDILEREFKQPVYVESTARAAVLGERAFGCGQGVTDLIYYHIGMGIGAGIISNGILYHGTNKSAGEIGHTIIDEFGPPCACGNFGCLEAMASAKAIQYHAIASLEKGVDSLLKTMVNEDFKKITSETVFQAAEQGDKLSRHILQEAGTHLGIGAANLINILNPSLLIIGGGLANAGDYVLEPLIRTMQERSLTISSKAVQIRVSQLGESAAPLGATTLILQRVFAIPELPAPPEIETV